MIKRIVRSWDVFDTVIARRCGAPHAIFELMAAALGDDFPASRVRAEGAARALKAEVSLEDIYDHLRSARGWSADQRQAAMELELRLELDNVIPVAENLARVRDGDVLVSDMYLPHEFILRLLRTAGLARDVRLFVSTNGKGDGSIWRRLRNDYLILKHTGDDPVRDFLRPLTKFVPAALTDASFETAWERLLRCNGAPALGAYVREMRLRMVDRDPASRTLRKAQIEGNFPLLLLASAALVSWCRAQGVRKALMASRDCVLWSPLAERVARRAGDGLAVEYFLISRVAALKGSASYLEYARRRMTPDAVVVDLSMTGVSLAGLAERLGIADVRAFVLAWHQSAAKTLYGDAFRSSSKVRIESLLAEVAHADFEAFNQALKPSVHDVVETIGGVSVTYGSENRSRAVIDAIGIQNDTFAGLLDQVPDAVLDEALSLAQGTRLVFLVRECERHASTFETIVTRASPGAALPNDPNGIALNLGYAKRNSIAAAFAKAASRLVRPLFRPGSSMHQYGKILPIVLRTLKREPR
jgi:hypothetical protein